MTAARSAGNPAHPHRGLSVLIWVLQAILALFFLVAGVSHAFAPLDQVAKSARWAADVPAVLVRFIGIAELAGAIGIMLPAAARRAPSLTPLAAFGLALIMMLAIPFHLSRGESNVICLNAVVAAIALFVAWGRFRGAPIAPRA